MPSAQHPYVACRTALRHAGLTHHTRPGSGKHHRWRLKKHNSYQTADYAGTQLAYRDDTPWDESARAGGRGRKAAVNAAVYEVRARMNNALQYYSLKSGIAWRSWDPGSCRRSVIPNRRADTSGAWHARLHCVICHTALSP